MSEQNKATAGAEERRDLSRETAVRPRRVSAGFIEALRAAGARPSLVDKLEKQADTKQ